MSAVDLTGCACEGEATSTLVLDGAAGWPVAEAGGVTGTDDPTGLRLAPVRPRPEGAVPRSIVDRAVPPARLATDGRGRWYVAVGATVRVFQPWRTQLATLDLGTDDAATVVALAARPGVLAVARRAGPAGADTVVGLFAVGRDAALVGEGRGRPVRPLGEITRRGVSALVFTRHGHLLVVHDPGRLTGVDLGGRVVFTTSIVLAAGVPPLGPVVAAGTLAGPRPRAWRAVVVGRLDGPWRDVLVVDPASGAATRPGADGLGALTSAPRPGLVAVTDRTVTFGDECRSVTFDEAGRALDDAADADDSGGGGGGGEPEPEVLVATGSLVTGLLDGGTAGRRWHRVEVRAETPAGTGWVVELRTQDTEQDEPEPDLEPDPDGGWAIVATDTRPDALVQSPPPGRYARLRVRLRGDGRATPVIRRIVVHVGRSTSIEHLPAVFRADPVAADFTERFLSLFDAALADVDDVVAHAPLLLRADALPDGQLPALARLVGIDVDEAWSPAELRRLLGRLPAWLYRGGTVHALETLLDEVFGVSAAVEEHGRERPWAGLGRAPLGTFRLYGRTRAGMVLGRSLLGRAPLRDSLDEPAEAASSGAFRCTVHLGPDTPAGTARREAIERVVRWALPAHLAVDVRQGAPGRTTVGRIRVGGPDQVLAPVEPSVLGGPPARRPRLGRTAVVGAAAGRGAPRTPGRPAVVGIDSNVR